MKILVTGGLGFIGSHTIVELIKCNHEVIIVDSLVNSQLEVLDKLNLLTSSHLVFYPIDVTDEFNLESVFSKTNIDGVIHFAGLKAVGDSVIRPLDYYYNNLVSTMLLVKLCVKYNVNKFVFSSSATVYGNQPSPLNEKMQLEETTNPYGETKAISERILRDAAIANPELSMSLLRYFNPVGAHKSGLIGENPRGIPNNLMPYITRVARGVLPKLYIYGNDYNTVDGTAVRDYIHVVDIARGHVKAIEHMRSGANIYNLGTGQGTSVLELVNTFTRINGVNVMYEFAERRVGDLATCFADVSKAKEELNWKATHSVEDMVKDAWNFELVNNGVLIKENSY